MADYTELILYLRKIGRKIIQFGNPIYKDRTALRILDAADVIEELGKPKWIPVTERLPEVNKYVLGCFKDNSMTAVCLFDIDEHMTFWRACTDEGWEADCDSEPTYWMPLPEPPEEE